MSCLPRSIRDQLDVAEMIRTVLSDQKRAAAERPAVVRETVRQMLAASLEENA